MTNEERQLLADIRKEASSGLRCISFGNNCISRLWQIVNLCDSVLDKPQRKDDIFGGVEALHTAFLAHCDKCGSRLCPNNKDTRCALDSNFAAIIECFARFVVNNKQTTRTRRTKMETNEIEAMKDALVLIADTAELLHDMLRRGNADKQCIKECVNIINVARETIGSVAPTKGAKRGESK